MPDPLNIDNGRLPSLRYSQARPLIRSGDLLLFRSRGLKGQALQIAGRGRYTHAAMAVWWGRPAELPYQDGNGILCVCETVEGIGGRIVPLSRYVAEYPGTIEVFSINTHAFRSYDRWGAVEWALRNIPGVRYGTWTIVRIALSHLPIFRWFIRPDTDNVSVAKRRPVCSTARAMADRIGGGVDPVPHLADEWCEPSDLAKSLLYRQKFRLVPDGPRGEGLEEGQTTDAE